MLLTIHDANLKKVAFIDNEKQSTLNYFDDVWTRNLETGSSTFEFTVFKKATDKAYNYLNEKAFVSFEYNGKSYVFNVMTVEENEQTITCYCENLNLELINEYANSYKATNAMSFVEYCNAMDLLNYTYLSVGINEISDQKRTLEWDGQDTKLARLLSLAKKFDAEIDFDTKLNADSSIKSFKVNVYHKNDGIHQGVGRIRNDIQLTYGKNLKSITRKIDKTNVVNAIRPTGTKDGNTVVISGLSAWEEKNADGVVEFYQKGELLYAPISMQLYPSAFINGTTNDQWTRKDITVDSDDPVVIRSAGIRELKKNAYPAITYDVDGFVDLDIGDTVKIHDDGFNPILLIEARVADQKISFTNPDNNKTTFANFTALENRLSDGIQERLNELIEQAKAEAELYADNIKQSIDADVSAVNASMQAQSERVSTLAGSYAITNLTNSGTVLNQLNLNKDGPIKIDGSLAQITGTTYIQDGVISSAKIASLDAGKITAGTLDAARIATNSITGSHISFDQAFFNRFTANEAYLNQLFAKNAFITSVQAVAISASNVTTGILRATNGALDIDLDNANLTFNQSATINFNSDSNALVRKKGDVTAFVNFADDLVSGGVYAGFGVTSHNVGVTTASNSDSGKFAGMRVYRPNDSVDLLRLIGDTVTIAHGTEGNYFNFKPVELRNNVDMIKLAGAVYTLSRIFIHLRANGWSFSNPSFISGVQDEMARNWLDDFAIGGSPR